jgi:16S rRNA (adenine1518-N6/adenine1519-N6)-dimethyltransferase
VVTQGALKKSLGQHLLKDRNLLAKMVRLAGLGKADLVVEIGPGQGDLTRCVAERTRGVCAVEKDERFRDALAPLERELPNVRVLFADVLKVRLSDLWPGSSFTVMGNIPYNITGEILFKLLAEKGVVKGAHLTMQKEVAERLVSRSHSRSYGALSVIFQLHAAMKILLRIKPALFIPPPKVESAFISIVFRDTEGADHGLIDFVKGCFRYKRKFFRHALEDLFEAQEIEGLYRHMAFPASVRAEEIEPAGFLEMHRFMEKG